MRVEESIGAADGDILQCKCGCQDFVIPLEVTGRGTAAPPRLPPPRVRCLQCGAVWQHYQRFEDDSYNKWEKLL